MKRLEYISVLRVVTMLIVVFYHCLCGYGIWQSWSWHVVPFLQKTAVVMNLFHMPMFVLISGFLFCHIRTGGGYSELVPFFKKKVKRVLLPYVLWAACLYPIFGKSGGSVFRGYLHLWFLLFIFQAYLTCYFIDKLLVNKRSEALLFFASLLWMVLNARLPFNVGFFGLSTYLHYIPYYVIGVVLYRYIQRHTPSVIFISVGLAVCAAGFGISYFVIHKCTLASLFVLFILVLVICLMSRITITVSPSIKTLDRYSMAIYILHHPIIQLMNMSEIGTIGMPHYYIYPIVQFFVVMVLSVLLSHLLLRCKFGRVILGG